MATMILTGVPIYTMDGQQSVCEALVIEDERIRYTGDSAEAKKRYPDAEAVVIEKGCILPGFIDAHMHLRDFALLFRDLDLSSVRLKDELLERVQMTVADREKDKWITGGGASFRLLESVHREDLDAVTPHNPLVLYSRDMHSMLVNTAVLAHCHIDDSRQDPMGGKIERDTSDRPSGILRERAIDLVKRHIPEEQTVAVQSAIGQGVEKLLSCGVTTLCDCSIYAPDLLMHTLMKRYHQGKLLCRAVVMYDDRLSVRLGSMGIQSLFGNNKVKVGGCKLILDGSLSSMTAAMSRPYVGKGTTGMLLMEENELYQILKRSYNDHLWAGVHAIGDRAVEIALRVFQKIGKEIDVPKLPKRIEHAQTLNDEDVGKFADTGIIPVVNPAHIPFDRMHALAYLGSRARLEHRIGSLLEAGATLAMGSDAPVGPVNPLYGLYAAVERKDFEEGPEFRFFPRECIELGDALYAYTMGSAAAVGMEHELGSLEKGKYADIVVLSHDVFKTEIGILRDIKVQMTIVGGEIVYDTRRKN